MILEASDGGVERAGSELHGAVGLLLDGLPDEVAVAVAGGEGQEDLVADGGLGGACFVCHWTTSTVGVLVRQIIVRKGCRGRAAGGGRRTTGGGETAAGCCFAARRH